MSRAIVKAHQVGHTIVITIPKHIREQIQLEHGDWVMLSVNTNNNSLTITKEQPTTKRTRA